MPIKTSTHHVRQVEYQEPVIPRGLNIDTLKEGDCEKAVHLLFKAKVELTPPLDGGDKYNIVFGYDHNAQRAIGALGAALGGCKTDQPLWFTADMPTLVAALNRYAAKHDEKQPTNYLNELAKIQAPKEHIR